MKHFLTTASASSWAYYYDQELADALIYDKLDKLSLQEFILLLLAECRDAKMESIDKSAKASLGLLKPNACFLSSAMKHRMLWRLLWAHRKLSNTFPERNGIPSVWRTISSPHSLTFYLDKIIPSKRWLSWITLDDTHTIPPACKALVSRIFCAEADGSLIEIQHP